MTYRDNVKESDIYQETYKTIGPMAARSLFHRGFTTLEQLKDALTKKGVDSVCGDYTESGATPIGIVARKNIAKMIGIPYGKERRITKYENSIIEFVRTLSGDDCAKKLSDAIINGKLKTANQSD